MARYAELSYGEGRYAGGVAVPFPVPDAGFCLTELPAASCGGCGLNPVWPGALVRRRLAVLQGDTDADPPSLTFLLLSPSGSVARYDYGLDPALQRDAVGRYHLDFSPTKGGEWHYRWEVEGGAGATEGSLEVEMSAFALA
jgi:hypothetical protein